MQLTCLAFDGPSLPQTNPARSTKFSVGRFSSQEPGGFKGDLGDFSADDGWIMDLAGVLIQNLISSLFSASDDITYRHIHRALAGLPGWELVGWTGIASEGRSWRMRLVEDGVGDSLHVWVCPAGRKVQSGSERARNRFSDAFPL